MTCAGCPHLARAARTYAARRHALIAGLFERAPQLRISGVDAGLRICSAAGGPIYGFPAC